MKAMTITPGKWLSASFEVPIVGHRSMMNSIGSSLNNHEAANEPHRVRTIMKRSIRHNNGQVRPVQIEFFDEQAQAVAVAGTFNRWDPSSRLMARIERGHWLTMLFLPPGRYEYCIVVDGCWQADPAAREFVPNVFGCLNSVLTVPAPTECAPRRLRPSLVRLRNLPAKRSRSRNSELEACKP